MSSPYTTEFGSQNLTVVVQQPTVSTTIVENDWHASLFGCCFDWKICLFAACCWPCFECKVACDMDESCLLPFCVPAYQIALRTKLRTREHLSGSILGDCGIACMFPFCSLIQVARENKHRKG
ncbi:placenta-specific gene 8 protein-like [Physella acuta]|uniref:placenta-specific gene 8 protein-like n=1 Tax=Physella acuta TaxID=109671 RepID=UPI0027DE1F26|nr:placenta-specific gene 8 protein-like [Physella acuta]